MKSMCSKSGHPNEERIGGWGVLVVWVIVLGISVMSFSAGGHLQMLFSPLAAWFLSGALLGFLGWRLMRERRVNIYSLVGVFVPWLIYNVVNFWVLSLTPWYGRVELLGLGCAAIVFVSVLFLNEVEESLLGKGVMCFGVLVIFLTMFQSVMGASWHPVGGVNSIRAQYGERLSSVFSMPNSLGCCMLMILPYFLLHVFCGKRWQLSYALGAVACMWALHASVSRAAILVAVPVILLVCYFGAGRWKRRLIYAVMTFVVYIGMYFAVSGYAGNNEKRFEQLADSGGEVTREVYFAAAHALIEQSPIFGVGLGNFQVLWDQQFPVNRNHGEHFTHSDYLQVLCETGVVGGALLFGAVAFIIFRVLLRLGKEGEDGVIVRIALCALLGFSGHQLVNFESRVWSNLLVATVFFAVLVRYASFLSEWRLTRVMRVMIGLMLIGAVCVWGSVYADAQSTWHYSRGALALNRVQGFHSLGLGGPKEKLAEAELGFERAIAWRSDFMPAYWFWGRARMSHVYYGEQSIEDLVQSSVGKYDEAITLCPQYWRLWSEKGLSLARDSNRSEEAGNSLRVSLELVPNHTSALMNYALFLHRYKKFDEMRAVLEHVLVIDPEGKVDGARARQMLDALELEKEKSSLEEE